MKNILKEMKYDLNFIKSHTLQPKWYKLFKIILLIGFLSGYSYYFGCLKTMMFFALFAALSAAVHFLYRYKTQKWKQSWLDFIVYIEDGNIKYKRIGIYYYCMVLANFVISILLSQLMA